MFELSHFVTSNILRSYEIRCSNSEFIRHKYLQHLCDYKFIMENCNIVHCSLQLCLVKQSSVLAVSAKGSSSLGQRAVAPKSRPWPQMWYETLFDELKALKAHENTENGFAFDKLHFVVAPRSDDIISRKKLKTFLLNLHCFTFWSAPTGSCNLQESSTTEDTTWGFSTSLFYQCLLGGFYHEATLHLICSIRR